MVDIKNTYTIHRVLVVGFEETLEEKVAFLAEQGYRIDQVSASSKGLEKFIQAKEDPYALVMVFLKNSKIKGDGILEKAKKNAPETQRLLIADNNDFQAFIQAINSADIHACMPLPFTNQELLSQVRQRCDHFDTIQKLKTLKKTTRRQTRQLYQIAENFKKKDAVYADQADKLEKELRILKSRFRSAFGPVNFDRPTRVEDIVKRKQVGFNPKDFGEEFFNIKNQVDQILEIILPRHGLPFPSMNLDCLFGQPFWGTVEKSLAEKALPLFLKLIEFKEAQSLKIYEDIKHRDLDQIFTLVVSEDKLSALLSLTEKAPQSLTLFQVKRFLEKKKIIFGLKPDSLIEEWLYSENQRREPFSIARGKNPRPPKDAEISYSFPIDFLHAGKVNPDGSIDFRERGGIPHVLANEVLAIKKKTEKGEFGITVEGEQIPVEDPLDWGFSAGAGTRLSEQGNKIYSTINGQPHLDPMGTVSVCQEYQIQGDIGFETGNVEFEGNVVVTGAVRQGFKVKCISLTAREICGAEIDLSGDLNVSLGIIDTELVNVRGNVQAKFIRNSKINSFGDMIIQKEIIDSEIYLSGACINEKGIILNSKISAKMGIQGGTIGNQSSPPSVLTVGVDEHSNRLIEGIESKIASHKEGIKTQTDEVRRLEDENHKLHAAISKNAHIQDRSQLAIKDIEKQIKSIKGQENKTSLRNLNKQISQLSQKAKKAEAIIDKGFERQDEISLLIPEQQLFITELETKNTQLLKKKQRLLELSSKKTPYPEVSISDHIQSRTRIFTGNSQKTISQSLSRCRIKEICSSAYGQKVPTMFEIKVVDF